MFYINIFWIKSVKAWLLILIYRFDENNEKLKNQNDKKNIDDDEEIIPNEHCKYYLLDLK